MLMDFQARESNRWLHLLETGKAGFLAREDDERLDAKDRARPRDLARGTRLRAAARGYLRGWDQMAKRADTDRDGRVRRTRILQEYVRG